MRFALPAAVAALSLGILAADLGLAPVALACRALSLAALLAAWRCRREGVRLLLALASVATLGAAQLSAALEAADHGIRLPLEAVVDAEIAGRSVGVDRVGIELARIRAVDGRDVPGRAVLWVAPDAVAAAIPVGASLRAALRFTPAPPARNPGGRDGARSMARRGIGALAKLQRDGLVVETRPPRCVFFAAVDRLRAGAGSRLIRHGQGGALLATLALGDRSGLGPEFRDAAARGGVAHLLAVSGLHLALVAGASVWLTRRVLISRRMLARFDARRVAWLGGLAAGAGYLVLSGAPISMRRAFLFLCVLGAAAGMRRAVTGAQRLAVAAAALLFADPANLFDPGAQLSFAATAGLLAGFESHPEAGIGAHLRSLLSAAAAAALATAPIAAFHFGTASAFGWVANLVAVPLTGFVLLPLALAAAAVEALQIPGLAGFVDIAAGVCRLALDAASWWARQLPLAATARPGLAGLLLGSVVAVWGISRRRLRWRALAAIACGAILAVAPASPIVPAPPRIVFLDVGWGDAVVVQGRSGAILVDGGGAFEGFDAGRSIVLPALAQLGIRRLDAVVVSHRDRDHVGGLPSVLGGLAVDELWLPFGAGSDPTLSDLVRRAREREIRVRELGAGSPRLARGDIGIEPLWPRSRTSGGGNAHSLVLRISVGDRTLLLTGDLDADGERALLQGGAGVTAEVLKLGHHGSRTSSHEAFLRGVAPRWAVVSAPEGGRLAFPHAAVLGRVQNLGIGLAWTGRDGAVLIGAASGSRVVRGWRGDPLPSEPAGR